MMPISSESLILALVPPLLLSLVAGVRRVKGGSYTATKGQCVECVASILAVESEPSEESVRVLQRRFSRKILLDAVMFISEYLYGRVLDRLAYLADRCGLYAYMIRQIESSHGYKRAIQLSRFANLATNAAVVDQLKKYTSHQRRDIRLYATVALVAAKPDHAMRYIVELDAMLTSAEVAMFMRLMCRVGAPIAYTPLLTSHNRNLQLIGIALVEHFLIVDAESHLQQLVESHDYDVAFAALYALCTIRGDLTTSQVCRAVPSLLPHHRTSFMRHAAYSCYSLHSCAHLLNVEERTAFAHRINSYKSRIECN